MKIDRHFIDVVGETRRLWRDIGQQRFGFSNSDYKFISFGIISEEIIINIFEHYYDFSLVDV